MVQAERVPCNDVCVFNTGIIADEAWQTIRSVGMDTRPLWPTRLQALRD